MLQINFEHITQRACERGSGGIVSIFGRLTLRYATPTFVTRFGLSKRKWKANQLNSHADFRKAYAISLARGTAGPSPTKAMQEAATCAIKMGPTAKVDGHYPIFVGKYAGSGQFKYRTCVLCAHKARSEDTSKKSEERHRTRYQCEKCLVGLHPECFKEHHFQ